jgi:hypothetical protein
MTTSQSDGYTSSPGLTVSFEEGRIQQSWET